MASTLCGCWQSWPMRRASRSEQEVSRGVSRKARRHIVKVRMPGSSFSPGGKPSPTTTEAIKSTGDTRSTLGFENSIPLEERAKGKKQGQGSGDAGAAAVAVKIRKGGFFGVFRRPVGGADDVVHVPVGQTCVICMEPFKPNEVLEVLLCQHLYHERCINRWLGDHTSCCVCKADMEEMAKAIQKPSRRLRSRARSETRSERSESFRSESGYGSDQARSTWSSVSAPAAFADRVPPDSSRPLGSAVSVLPNASSSSSRTSPRPSNERAAAARHGGSSPSPMPRSLNPRSPARSVLARSPTRNATSQAISRSPATPTAATGGGAASVAAAAAAAASSGSSASPVGPGVEAPSLRLSVSTFPPEWSLQCSRDSEERSSSCGSISSNEDHSHSSRSSENALNAGSMLSPSFKGPSQSPSPARVWNRSPRHQDLSHQQLSPAAIDQRPRSPSSSFPWSSARSMLRPPAQTHRRPPSPHPEGRSAAAPHTSQTIPRVSLPGAPPAPPTRAQERPRREFPSAVATLSTPQRMRRNSQPALSFLVESSLSCMLSDQVTTTPRRQWGSPSTPRRQPQSQLQSQPTSARSTPARRHRQWDPEQGMMAASISSCASNGGEPGRRKVFGEGNLTMDEERHCNELESGTALGGVGDAKHCVGKRLERWADEQGAKASSVSPCASDRVPTRTAWAEGELTMEEGKEERFRNKLEEGAARGVVDVGAKMLPDDSLPTMTAKPVDDWDPTSDSLLSAGKLNGWANTQEDEDWLEDFDKTPSSEIGSHKTCSTQWSEMESQLSGMESQLSGNSYPGEEGSVMSALPPRRRPIPALPTSPRQFVPTVAEAKCPPSLSVVVSPAVNKHCDPWHCRADGAGADTPGALTPGAVTPGALRARSVSAPMIWD